MEIVSHCPLRVGSIVWQPRAGSWVLTVVCKATFVLAPVESTLAEDQDDVEQGDTYWDDDETRSLCAASDLVPFKPRADVLLIGSAYAPRGLPASSVVARLVVGDIDKAIEVSGDRAWTPDGQLREGRQFTKMPLRWERAAGGQGTSNPVGIAAGGPPDRMGMIALPNLQAPSGKPPSRDDRLEPVCFGPIAPGWPTRSAKLRYHAASWSHGDWARRPLPEDIEGGYFNAAPPDQQVDGLRSNERIVLENLHPQHARLVTNLAGVRPIAMVEGSGQEITLRCDTLSIDTDRGRCSLTWRGQLPVADPYAAGRIVVSMVAAPAAQEAQPRPSGAAAPRPTMGGASAPRPPSSQTVVNVGPLRATLPFVRGGEGPRSEARPSDAVQRLAGMQSAQSKGPEAESALPFSAPAPPPAPAFVQPPPAVVSPPVSRVSSTPWSSGDPLAAPTVGQIATAQEVEPAPRQRSDPPPAAPAPAPRALTTRSEYVDLLWFDKDTPKRIRAEGSWLAALRDEPTGEGAWMTGDEAFEQKQEANDRRDVVRAMSRVPALDGDGILAQMVAAIDDDGVLGRTLVVVRGEISLSFDPVETLKATVAVASPLASADKKLKDLITAAGEALGTEWRLTAAIAEGMTARIAEAFAQANRSLPASYLDANVERILLEQRRYDKRTILGGPRLRATIMPAGAAASAAIPAYLPEHLERELPMFRRFQVAAVAEAHGQQDQFETHAVALLVLAIGRVLPVPGRVARAS